MSALDNYNKKYIQRLGNDSVYGQGTDGDVTISSNTTLTSDKYYNNLTVDNNTTLLTNGYRIFVKGTLTNNGYIGVGTNTGGEPTGASSGTILGPNTLTAITYSLGGAGGGGTANAAPTWLVNNLERLLEGELATRLFNPSAGQSAGLLYGGGAGVTGAQGHTNPAYTNSDHWTGKSGNAGGAGVIYDSFAGGFHYHSNEAASHGAINNAGNAGNSGTAPNSGGAGIGGAGGAGGVGGGVVLIFAKSIAGTGTIFAKGKSGSAGSAGQTGATGTAGNNGNTGYHAYNVHYSHGCLAHTHDCKGHYCQHNSYHAYRNYHGGAGGTGGAGSPAKTGGTGETGYKGGGGGIVIVTDSTPSNQTYLVSAGSTGTGSASAGFNYIILNA